MQKSIRIRPARLVLIILLVIVLGWVTGEKLAIRSELGEGPRQTLITVSAEGVEKFIADAVLVGDHVFKKNDINQLFGKIVDVEAKPAKMPAVDQATGRTKIGTAPEHYDVFVTIEATTSRSPYGNVLIHNGVVELNQYLPLWTNHASIKTRVIGIEDKKEGNG
ncbi:DUF4330 domain-containing protein [Brevibacillus humidisoli]|uniref:DUF4330 family protein n=1 Tax=Brevibacillus humidisoli TaxID=2895522 RepID=UPI001E335CBA|nr:DUF4330 family protein [Brevibacillus humidisoli]UFJ39151.1 DUF4330 domain-containing protein [Brevibacillus humidisoli]